MSNASNESNASNASNKEYDADKQHIIELFNNNVRGLEICLDGQNTKHCGKEGHWLETKMGIQHNSKNEPDINGYEMKKSSKKTTLGDFSASEYAFSQKNKRVSINIMNNWTDEMVLNRSSFIKIFGNPNPKKNNRCSWSGSCVPTYNDWNSNGQILTISKGNDIIIYYSFSKDTRSKKTTIPIFLQHDNIVIALWKAEKMREHPYLYKIYFASILLTKNCNKLDYNSIFYSVNKRIIWNNLYITNIYNNINAYFSEFPKFSFTITNNEKINNIMFFIITEINLIDEKLLLELIDEEEIKLNRELKHCEKYFNYVNANRIILSKVLPDNFPEDLHYFILNYFC